MGFLGFTLQLIDFLAWPVLALAYPLCASVRAIETGSKYHMRKLVTYWTVFSFVSLFEHVFEKLIEWVPLWPYMKLIIICCLVIPHFNGACYFYQKLIHPCLLVKLHEVITQFCGSCYVHNQRLLYLCSFLNLQTFTAWVNKPMEDPSLKNETFLAVAERYVEENGTDALEKLIANKSKDYSLNHHVGEIKTIDTRDGPGMPTPNQTGCEGGGPVWEDIKVMEYMAKHEAAETKKVKDVKENLIQIEKKTTAMPVKEIVVPADAQEIKLPEITSLKQVQTEWTCAVCQVSTTSEYNLNSHFNGRKHKAKCEELKTCKKTGNSEGNLPVATNKSNQEQVKLKEDVNLAPTSLQEKPKQLKNGDVAFHDTTRPWCGTCNKWCSGEIAMAAHVKGRKHLAKLRKTTSSLAAVEMYLEDNRSNALEKLVANEVKSVKENLIQVEEKTTSVQVKKTKPPVDTEEIKPPETNSSKNVQTEWTCAICQVTTTSEHDLKCHLRGKKHLEKLAELKTLKRTAKTERKPKENVQVGGTGQHEKQVKTAGGGTTHNSKLWCSFCNVRCPGEIDMTAHLNGKKHLAKLEETMSTCVSLSWGC